MVELNYTNRGGMDEIKAHPWFANVDWDAMLRMEVKPPKLGKCKKGTVNIQPPKLKNARASEDVQLDDESKELFQTFDFVVRADNGEHDMGRIDVCSTNQSSSVFCFPPLLPVDVHIIALLYTFKQDAACLGIH